MYLLLELVRLAHLRADDTGVYVTDIRAHLAKHAGMPSRRYRGLYETWGPRGSQQRSYSLWSSPAEKAAKELRNAARKKTGQPPKQVKATVSGRTTTISLRDED